MATTLPVYEITSRLCRGTDISVAQLITENVSCLHDYTLRVDQMQALEQADLVILNGAGLEDFMEDALFDARKTIDASSGIALSCAHGDHQHADHTHEQDPHVWLSPNLAKSMSENICSALCKEFPQFSQTFEINKVALLSDLDAVQTYAEKKLSTLSCRQLITFHDGFHYLAESFDLQIIRSVEEESGAEASAEEIIEIIHLVNQNQLPAIFVEKNGSTAAAGIISAESGAKIFTLDMCMSGDSYLETMYRNIDTLWEALQ